MKNNQQLSLKGENNPDPVDVKLGERLRQQRNIAGMSQSQLGKASGLTFQQIQKYERGANRMSASRLLQLAGLLGVPVGVFFAGLGDLLAMGFGEDGQAPLEDMPGDQARLFTQRETLELVRAYYRIRDAKQRKHILEIVRSMGGQS